MSSRRDEIRLRRVRGADRQPEPEDREEAAERRRARR